MKAVYERRVKMVRDFLRANKLRAFLVMTEANRFYMSGFFGSAGSVLITSRKAQLFVDGRYTLMAKRDSALPVLDISELPSKIVKGRPGTVAVEDQISLRDLKQLKKVHKGLKWKEAGGVLEQMREQKNRAELKNIKTGSDLIDRAFYMIKEIVRQCGDLTELAIAQAIEKFGRENGALRVAFEPIVAWGKNSAMPHHKSSTQKIGNNNFLLLDFGFTFGGYQSDFTRTLFIGRPSSWQRDIYESVLEAQVRAVDKVRIGERASIIDATARTSLKNNSYSKFYTHNTGHGVGLQIHESPNLAMDSMDKLVENSVVTVEPGVYLPNKGGVRIEDMVLVAKRPKVFSKVPKNWEEMVVSK